MLELTTRQTAAEVSGAMEYTKPGSALDDHGHIATGMVRSVAKMLVKTGFPGNGGVLEVITH